MSSPATDRKSDLVPIRKEAPIEVGARELRNQVGELIARACWAKERFVITRNGKRIAAIVGISDFDALESLDALEQVAVVEFADVEVSA